MSKFIIMTACAKMPSSCWGRYGKIAIVEVKSEFNGVPKMISERARGVVRIVYEWDRLHIGKTSRCEYERTMTKAREILDRLAQGLH